MQNDNEFPVTYSCDCGASHTIAGTSPKRISTEFEALGWTNAEMQTLSGRVDYVVLCPGCIADYHDEALAMEREQQADNDYFLTGTGRR